MSEIYQSTKALSVYNALSFAKRDMPREDVDALLRANFDPALPGDYVDQGVAYLLDKRLASEADGVLKIERQRNGLGVPVMRSADSRDLLHEAR